LSNTLADTSETLRSLLETELAADVGPGGLAAFFGGANTEVSIATPEEMTRVKKQGLSVWLYRVARDEMRLNDPPTVRPLSGGGVELVPPPLPLRLHYLMTPLASKAPDTEQKILGRVLRAFHARAILSGALLRGDLTGTDAELHVRLEQMSLEEITRVWEALEGSYQLSISYEVTLALIESTALPLRPSLVESVRRDSALILAQETAL
jgi:Pvc16 N-terminal domain